MTPRQIELARHALGLPNARRCSHRNSFICGPGHADFDEWMAMVLDGTALHRRKRGAPAFVTDIFCLTRSGAEAALKPGERLDLEDLPEARS